MGSAATFVDEVDQALLAEIQQQFPIDHRPYQTVGKRLDMSEQECLERIGRLKSGQVIRQIGGLFDGRVLGYHRTVVAMRVDAAQVDEAAAAVGGHPGVSHLIKRNDPLNLWCAIAVPPAEPLERTVSALAALATTEETIFVPTRRLYKLAPLPGESTSACSIDLPTAVDEAPHPATKPALTHQDVRLIRVMQEDLPLLEMPFVVWAEQAETTEEELFEWAKRQEHTGAMQRFAAFCSQRPAGGARTPALVAWQVPPEAVEVAGEQMGQFREVSHCYERSVSASWPYALFSAIQAGTDAACMEVVKRIEARVGRLPHKRLFNVKEYKRLCIKYFSPDLSAWWDQVGHKALI